MVGVNKLREDFAAFENQVEEYSGLKKQLTMAEANLKLASDYN